jgi:hypothetical protein
VLDWSAFFYPNKRPPLRHFESFETHFTFPQVMYISLNIDREGMSLPIRHCNSTTYPYIFATLPTFEPKFCPKQLIECVRLTSCLDYGALGQCWAGPCHVILVTRISRGSPPLPSTKELNDVTSASPVIRDGLIKKQIICRYERLLKKER